MSKITPATEWIAEYDGEDLTGDLSAGATVGVMLIPQSMAYAMLAGVPPIYGLYAGLIPLLVYALLGTSRHLAVGPVTVDMLIVGAGVGAIAGGEKEHIALAILVAAMTGVIEIAMSAARFGFMVNFLSRPVIAGFMTAAPLIIASNQLGNLVGLQLPDSQYVHVQVWAAIQKIAGIHPETAAIGGVGIVVLLALQWWRPKWPAALIWVVAATAVSWGFEMPAQGVDAVGRVPEGLPAPEIQAWSWSAVWDLAPTALTLALVQFMYVMSLGQAFASEHDYSVDANRELFAIGAANLAGSFFRGVPVSGSFSRSVVNNRAGAKTPASNIVASVLVGLTLLFLTPLFQFLPVPALAAIIMVACIGMIDIPELRYLLETRWLDGAVALTTFVATLVIGIQSGILVGVGASIVVVLYDLAQPNVVELGHVPGTQEFRDLDRNPEAEGISGLRIIRIDSRFSFANAKILRDELIEEIEDESIEEESIEALIIDISGVNDVDTTATAALREVVEEVGDRGLEFYVVGAKGPIRDVMRRSGLDNLIGEENFFLNSHLAVKEILEDWDDEEAYAPADREQRRGEVDEARKRLEEERERLVDERERVTEERDRLLEEVAEHEEEREALDEEEEQLKAQLERAKERREELRDERKEIESTQEKLEEHEEVLDELEDELEERADHLAEQEQELEEREKELAEERREVAVERNELLDERERLRSEISDHLDERDALQETREQLREELDRVEQQRRELESERERMERQREEIREQQRELEAEKERLAAAEREATEGEADGDETSTDGGESDADDSSEERRDPNEEFDQPI